MSAKAFWWPDAEEDLRALRSWRDAAWIDSEVRRYAEDGVGDLRRVLLPSGRSVHVLFLPGFRVVMSVDRASRALHIWRILRALPKR